MWVWIAMVLGFAAAALGVKVWLLRRCARQMAQQLADWPDDTNTPVWICCRDRCMRQLAAEINRRMQSARQAELRYMQGDAALKTAVTGISHDLRTPLTAITSYLELLEQKPQSPDAQRYLAVIRGRTDAMRVLTEDLLQYSAAAEPSPAFTPEKVSLNAVLEESLLGLYAALQARGIEPVIRMPAQPVMRSTDRRALCRIFSNLLNNALKYSDGDLQVELDDTGTVTFSNTASQLDAVQVEQLFDRFYTVQAASGSTGLGLSIARTLTEQLHGQLSAHWKEGRLFIRFVLPAE